MELSYLKCKQCNNRIHTKDVEIKGNSKILTCPYCLAQNLVNFKRNGFREIVIEIVGLKVEA